MIIYDLLALIVLVLIYLLFKGRNQFLILISSVAFAIAIFVSSEFAKPIFELLKKNGWTYDPYMIILVYLVLIILLWGIIYAIFSLFSINTTNIASKIMLLVSSVLTTFGAVAIACFVFGIFNDSVGKITVCRVCLPISRMESPENKKNAIVPVNLGEVFSLPVNTKIVFEDEQSKKKLLKLINEERLDEQKQILVEDLKLSSLARNYANSMIQSLRFSHIDANNNTPDQRAKQQQIEYIFLGENLAIAPTIEQAHKSLMNSETHRKNILSQKFNKVGISCFLLSSGSYIVVEEFSD